MKARILTVPPDRLGLYAPWITEALAEILAERTPDAGWIHRVEQELVRERANPALLLLVAELVDPTAIATMTTPAGYTEASLLLALPDQDPLIGGEGAVLRVLHTKTPHRQRGLATGLLRQAEEILTTRGVPGIRVDVMYGDDAIVGLFERREYMRGRMGLHRSFTS